MVAGPRRIGFKRPVSGLGFRMSGLEEDRIYINDGPISTSAGMTAGIDLVLAMIDRDLGSEVAKAVAKLMVINQRRMGGQKQHSALLDMTPKSDRIELVVAHIRQNLRGTPLDRRARSRRQPQPPSVQPHVSGRDRPVTGKSGRATSDGSCQVHDGRRPALG